VVKPEIIIGTASVAVAVLFPIAKWIANEIITTKVYRGKTDEHEKYINHAREHTDGRSYDRPD
jgi:hypothetical protein